MYVKVALNVPTRETFIYAVPPELVDRAVIGCRVSVPFGKRTVEGFIVDHEVSCTVPTVREILAVGEEDPFFRAGELAFYRWLADYYLYPMGKLLAEVIPVTGRAGKKARGPRPVSRETPGAVDGGSVRVRLNDDQRAALGLVLQGLRTGRFCSFLLHGVTGSGKTEVYLRAVDEVIKNGGGVIFLVPEIGLTPQLIQRLCGRFPKEPLAVLHSGESLARRREAWRLLKEGKVRLAVGARSALFAPVADLRLIIVDEEHDDSYKQDERLRYNARDMALVRGRMAEAVVLLGSATPSVQTFYHALAGKHRLVSLPKRVEERSLPKVDIVDLRLERREKDEDSLILSRYLRSAMREALDRKKQVLLLLNRRGFHTVRVCHQCGEVLRCRNCSMGLVYHASAAVLVCHYCDFRTSARAVCPQCGGGPVLSYGFGTERLTEVVRRYFPLSRVGRMDRDTTARRGAHERILSDLAAGWIDILVGTQMVAKGHDYPGVVLVGIVSADTALHLPDFRAAERTFQLLTQSSGRGGRGEDPGRVVIQTFNPGHYALKWARNHDYEGFFREEIAQRQALGYPPFSRLANILVSSRQEERAVRGAADITARLRALRDSDDGMAGVEIIGPAESPIAKLRGRYRRQILLKGRDCRILHVLLDEVVRMKTPAGVDVKVDVDPVNFM